MKTTFSLLIALVCGTKRVCGPMFSASLNSELEVLDGILSEANKVAYLDYSGRKSVVSVLGQKSDG